MGEERLTLLLLPGMDGTGELFADFVPLLPSWIEPRVVSYPSDKELSYDELLPFLTSALPSHKPYVILAESFSTPLAVKFAAERSEGLRALVLCAGFVLPPRRNPLTGIALLFGPTIFTFGLPKSVCRYYLVGKSASTAVVNKVCKVVSVLSSKVLAHRLRSVLTCNAERDLRSISIPLLTVFGRDDRLLSASSCRAILEIRPDASNATIESPHLILQTKPHEAIEVILPFLNKVRNGPSE